jgi:hypothetical protein
MFPEVRKLHMEMLLAEELKSGIRQDRQYSSEILSGTHGTNT